MEFRKLVSPCRKGGMRCRKILEYVAVHPGAVPYEVAQNVFGNGVSYTGRVLSNARRLTSVGGVEVLKMERDKMGRYHLYLTEEGRKLCQAEGLQLPSGKPWPFITELNRQLEKPLTPGELTELESLLTEPVLQALEEIRKAFRPNTFHSPSLLEMVRILLLSIFYPSPPSLLEAVWIYEAEKTVLLPKVERWKDSFFPYFMPYLKEILFPFSNLPPPLLMEVMEKIEFENLLKETLFAIQIARKRRVEAELDRLLSVLGKIVKKERAFDASLSREGLKIETRIRYFYTVQARLSEKIEKMPPEVGRDLVKIFLKE